MAKPAKVIQPYEHWPKQAIESKNLLHHDKYKLYLV